MRRIDLGVRVVSILQLCNAAALACVLLVSCASLPTGDAWLTRTQQLVAESTKAHTAVLTTAGNAYKARVVQCETVAAGNGHVLFDCMLSANAGRTQIEQAATAYRTIAKSLLLAQSWAEVLAQLPALRSAAKVLAQAVGNAGGDGIDAHVALIAPVDEAAGWSQR